MNPYVNHLAGFGGGFIAFYPVEAGGGAELKRRTIYGSGEDGLDDYHQSYYG